jgi:transcriptional regulator GlxA family with amidase domain
LAPSVSAGDTHLSEDACSGQTRLRGARRGVRHNAITLRRRLEREGISYQAIKDQLRSDVAIDYLCNSNLSVDEIAARVGFQDASAFHRAFKRWNGLQPGEYRCRQAEAPAR